MAENCPYYSGGKCRNPNESREFDCSWPGSDYDRCSVYVLITDPARGRQQLLDSLGGGRVVRGSSMPKKWWQFWK